jgi:glycosyltransferase involved in cell wall biosynthesis
LDKKVPAGKAVVIFNAFESKSDKKTKKISDDPVIGTIGNLNSQKGQKYLIRALPSVLKKYPTAKIEIIGEGKERNSLVTETKRLNLQGKVTLLGKKTDLQKYLSDWTVFVLPSISETFGIVILEAMDAGIPVVATKSGGTTDIVKSGVNGLLVERKNPESLAKKIIKILDKPELAGDLTRNALKDLPRFSWTTIIGKLEDLYQSI